MNHRYRHGLSLVMIPIVMLILAIVGISLLQLSKAHFRSVATSRTMRDRDRVFDKLTESMVQPAVLLRSYQLQPSTTFSNCLDPANVAVNCPHNQTVAVDLYNSAGTQRISGTTGNPVYYDLNGNVCASAGTHCPLAITSEITPLCQGAVANCAQALQIRVRVRIEQAIAQLPTSSLRLANKSFEQTVDAKDIVLLGAQNCPDARMVQKGYDASGRIICSFPNNTSANCPAGQYVSGVNYNNGTITVNCAAQGIPPNNCPPNSVLKPNGSGGFQCVTIPVPEIRCRMVTSGLSGVPVAWCNSDEVPTGGGFDGKSQQGGSNYTCPGESLPPGGVVFPHFSNLTNDGRGWVANFFGFGGNPATGGDSCGRVYAICCKIVWPSNF